MFGLGFTEIMVILGIALIVLGPKRLPELARTLGRAMGQLRRASDEFKREVSFTSFDDIDKDIFRVDLPDPPEAPRGLTTDFHKNDESEQKLIEQEEHDTDTKEIASSSVCETDTSKS